MAAEFVRPLRGASLAWDAAASVLHFERIVAGRHLEAFVPTTPKPLITVVFGLLWALTHDWRAIAWATLAADAVGVVLAAELVRRSLGWVAASFAGIALVGCLALLYDVGYGLATPWAFAFVGAAGLALARPRPAHALAGVFLALGVLARLEVLAALGVAAAVLAARALVRRVPGGRPRPSEWAILVGLVSLPIMGLHDWLLTGDPLFWTTVATRYSETTRLPIATPAETVADLAARYGGPLLLLSAVAVVGVIALVRRRRWLLLAGVLAFGPGVASLLLVLAARDIYVPARYTAPIDLAVIVAAAAGVGWVADVVRGASDRRSSFGPARGPAVAAALVALAGVVAIVSAWPTGFLDNAVRTAIARNKAVEANANRVRPAIAGLVSSRVGAFDAATVEREPLVIVPNNLVPRFTVEFDVPFTTFATLVPRDVDPAVPFPGIGQAVLHDRHANPRIRSLEVSAPTPFGPALAVPVAVSIGRGYWLVEIRAR